MRAQNAVVVRCSEIQFSSGFQHLDGETASSSRNLSPKVHKTVGTFKLPFQPILIRCPQGKKERLEISSHGREDFFFPLWSFVQIYVYSQKNFVLFIDRF